MTKYHTKNGKFVFTPSSSPNDTGTGANHFQTTKLQNVHDTMSSLSKERKLLKQKQQKWKFTNRSILCSVLILSFMLIASTSTKYRKYCLISCESESSGIVLTNGTVLVQYNADAGKDLEVAVPSTKGSNVDKHNHLGALCLPSGVNDRAADTLAPISSSVALQLPQSSTSDTFYVDGLCQHCEKSAITILAIRTGSMSMQQDEMATACITIPKTRELVLPGTRTLPHLPCGCPNRIAAPYHRARDGMEIYQSQKSSLRQAFDLPPRPCITVDSLCPFDRDDSYLNPANQLLPTLCSQQSCVVYADNEIELKKPLTASMYWTTTRTKANINVELMISTTAWCQEHGKIGNCWE